jgi:hypothetical protein
VAWLAQQMAKTPIAGLLRIAWDTVGRIVERVVADHLDEQRLSGLVCIGVDEISYRRGQRVGCVNPVGLTRPRLPGLFDPRCAAPSALRPSWHLGLA